MPFFGASINCSEVMLGYKEFKPHTGVLGFVFRNQLGCVLHVATFTQANGWVEEFNHSVSNCLIKILVNCS
jgi:hypothetical protein